MSDYTDCDQRSDTSFLVGANYGRATAGEQIAKAIEARAVPIRSDNTPEQRLVGDAYRDAARIARANGGA